MLHILGSFILWPYGSKFVFMTIFYVMLFIVISQNKLLEYWFKKIVGIIVPEFCSGTYFWTVSVL